MEYTRDRIGVAVKGCMGHRINSIRTVSKPFNLDSRRIGVTFKESRERIKEALENRKLVGYLGQNGGFLKKIYEGDDE